MHTSTFIATFFKQIKNIFLYVKDDLHAMPTCAILVIRFWLL